MAQYFKDALGKMHEFPDDATPDEIDAATRELSAPAASQPPADFSGVTTSVGGGRERKPDGLIRQSTENLFGQAGANVLDAFQHHAMAPLHGVAQFVGHGVNAAANKLLPEGSGVRQYVNKTVASDDAALRQREADYQGRVPDGAAATGGAVVGEVLPWMVGLAQLKAAGLLPNLPRVGSLSGTGAKTANIAAKTGLLAAEGAAMGVAQPVTEGDYASTKAQQVGVGAVAAPVMGGAMAGVAKGSTLANYLTAGGRGRIAEGRLAKLYGTDPATLTALRSGTRVPGFELTPAQAIGTPEAVQAERVLRNNAQTAPFFAGRESSNNAALRDVVSGLAGQPGDMAAAKASRTAATQPYYDSLVGQPIPVRSVLDSLDALENSSLGVAPKVKNAVSGLRREIEQRTAGGDTIDASLLSGIRENVHRFLGDMPTDQEKKALAPIANTIAETIDAGVPGYRANLAAYAQASQPITDLKSARVFLDAIDSGGRDAGGNPTVDISKIRAALARDSRAKYKMSVSARGLLESVMEAAQKRSIANNNIAASGPGSAADVLRGAGQSPVWQRIGGQVLGGIGAGTGGLPGYLAGVGVAESAIAANNATLRQLGQRASSAPATADAIEAFQRRQQPGQLRSFMERYALPYQQ